MTDLGKFIITLIRLIVPLVLIVTQSAFAVGIGDLIVNSKIGEALDIDIELQVKTIELESLDVELAARSEFTKQNIPYPKNANLYKFSVTQHDSGGYVVNISTDNPIDDTFLHFMVSLNWSEGQLIREYTALLDPPLYSGESGTVANLPVVPAPNTTTLTDSVTFTQDTLPNNDPAPIPEPTSIPESAFSSEISPFLLTVKRGDTLLGIIQKLGFPEFVTRFQVLTAMLKDNPDAFIKQNMNRLKAGAVLRVPSLERIALVDHRLAVLEFQAQVAEYNQFLVDIGYKQNFIEDSSPERESLPDQSPSITQAPGQAKDIKSKSDETAATIESGQDGRITSELTEPVPGIQEARLIIGQSNDENESAGTTGGLQSGDAQLKKLRNQIAELDENLIVTGVQNEDIKNRLKQIQAQLNQVSNLIEIEDTTLAAVQDQPGQDDKTVLSGAESIDAAQISDDTNQENAEIVDPGKPVIQEQDVAVNQPEISQPVSNQPEPIAIVENQEQQAGITAVVDGFMGGVSNIVDVAANHILKIAGAVVLILGWLLYRRKRLQKEPDLEVAVAEKRKEPVIENAKQKPPWQTEPGVDDLDQISGISLARQDSGLQLTVGGGMSYLSDAGASGGADYSDLEQAGGVDPLAEAEVYLAYDRDEQAVQVLKEAYARTPDRIELAEKLFEIYHKQDDRIAFDKLAVDVNCKVPASDPRWGRVVAMGREVSPENPLYHELPEELDFSSVLLSPDSIDFLEKESENEDDLSLGQLSLNLDDIGVDDIEIPVDEYDLAEADPKYLDKTLTEQSRTTGEVEHTEPLPDEQNILDETKNVVHHPEEIDLLGDTEIDLNEIDLNEIDKFSFDNINEETDETNTFEDLFDDVDIVMAQPDASPDEIKPDAPLANFSETIPESGKVEISDSESAFEYTNIRTSDIPTIDDNSYLSGLSQQAFESDPYQEAETALELARAYIELGGKDIAMGFIEEVIIDGTVQQKAEAEELIRELV